MALADGFLVGGAVAQTPPDDKEPIPPRSIQLTAEQDHVIKEIVLKDMHIEPVPRSAEIRIGEKVPTEIELRTFPPLVAEKVPQVKTYKFFITENQIVVVSHSVSAYVGEAFLGVCFRRSCWLRRQLKYRCLLTTTQLCQQNNAPIRKFERIMVRPLLVLIHLSEECRRVT